jgi:predicted ester cyclase
MSIEGNKSIVRRIVAEVWNRDNLDAADELFAANFTRNGGDGLGPSGVKQIMAGISAAMPDLEYTIDDLDAEGDQVLVRWFARGTHTGEWQRPDLGQLAPTGRQITLRAMNLFRIDDGKAAEVWEFGDSIGFLRQIGATIIAPDRTSG